jgi:uronate dehydrogenase
VAEHVKLRPDPIGDHFEGGVFASKEFDGDASRIIDWTKR